MRRNYGVIGVIMGGPSAERDISLISGMAILEALSSKGYNAKRVEIHMPTPQDLKSLGIDVAFIALHGTFGEDGQIQSMLEELKIPYTGSRVQASRLGMNKIASRFLFKENNLLVPEYEVVKNSAGSDLKFDLPVVVKPAAQGSSIGVTIVDKKKNLEEAIEKASKFGEEVLVEKFVEGKEITVGILDDRPLPVVQIVPKRQFYDDIAKYTAGMTEYLVPAPIPQSTSDSARAAGLKAHKAIGCRSFSRVDMILNKDGQPVILEVNTIPGMTKLSLLPKAARAEGIDFAELCEKMLESAFKDG